MTDKEKIKEEIERLLKENKHNQHSDSIEKSLDKASKCRLFYELKKFIDSLPEGSGCEVNFTTKNEDLEEAAINAWNKYSGLELMHIEEVVAFFKEAAEWQKEQMKEALQTEYEKGRHDMRDEMMKDAISCNVGWYDGFILDYTQEQQDDILLKLGAIVGDKVKIIILKTE